MHAFTLAHISDEKLLADLSALAVRDRQTTAALLAHIAEVDARELFLPQACSSMFVYCTRVLHLAGDVAYKRIQAARAARRFPVLFEAIADGRLHVSGVVLLAPHLNDANVDEVVVAATHRTKAEIDMIVARLAPRRDLPEELLPREPPAPRLDRDPVPARQQDPDPVAGPSARVKPLSPDRFGLQVTISEATRDKLERAKALLRHRNPTGALADVLDRALDALLEKLEKQKFGATSRLRATKARKTNANPRYSTKEVKRGVHARDGEQCAYISKDGVRCTERGFLELDHETPVCLGGQPTLEEMRFLCHAHNQYAAELHLGADFMRAKRAEAKLARAKRATAKNASAAQAASATGAAATAEPNPPTTPSVPEQRRNEDVRGERTTTTAPFDADVTNALIGLGFKRDETHRAMAATADAPANTIEQRLRAALAALSRSRCSEGAFESPLAWVATEFATTQ